MGAAIVSVLHNNSSFSQKLTAAKNEFARLNKL
jgi:hypothetical protein